MTEQTDVDARLKQELSPGRRTRQMDDRSVSERRETTDEDRLRMFQAALFNDALPDLPEIPGYHTIWLTTTNPRDTIHRRMQLGYEPIRPEEVPGFEYASVKTGEWAGMIGVNEMLAFKLPLSLYQMFMKEAHHDAPLREEVSLADKAAGLREQAKSQGGDIIGEEGMQDLGRAVRAPTFT
jgi:hypothetical protein